MDVQLQDQRSGCIANLNSTCQNLAVGRTLLENVTWGSSDELSVETWVVYVASPTSRRCVFSLRRECDKDKENQRNNRVGPADQL